MNTHAIAERLHELGGFGQRLADLWFVADSGNKLIIETAFEHLFKRFNPAFVPGTRS